MTFDNTVGYSLFICGVGVGCWCYFENAYGWMPLAGFLVFSGWVFLRKGSRAATLDDCACVLDDASNALDD